MRTRFVLAALLLGLPIACGGADDGTGGVAGQGGTSAAGTAGAGTAGAGTAGAGTAGAGTAGAGTAGAGTGTAGNGGAPPSCPTSVTRCIGGKVTTYTCDPCSGAFGAADCDMPTFFTSCGGGTCVSSGSCPGVTTPCAGALENPGCCEPGTVCVETKGDCSLQFVCKAVDNGTCGGPPGAQMAYVPILGEIGSPCAKEGLVCPYAFKDVVEASVVTLCDQGTTKLASGVHTGTCASGVSCTSSTACHADAGSCSRDCVCGSGGKLSCTETCGGAGAGGAGAGGASAGAGGAGAGGQG